MFWLKGDFFDVFVLCLTTQIVPFTLLRIPWGLEDFEKQVRSVEKILITHVEKGVFDNLSFFDLSLNKWIFSVKGRWREN